MQNVANGGSHGQIRQGVLRDLFDGLDVLIDGAVVDWNCDNRKLPQAILTSTQSFTLNMSNVLTGSQGTLKIITSTASAIVITLDTNFTNKSDGAIGQEDITTITLPAATAKQYVLSYLCVGTTLHWFISGNKIVDWSTGINPTGWSSFTTKWAFYVDMGTHIFLSGCIEGTGTGTTRTAVLPFVPSALYTGTFNITYIIQSVNNTTSASGLLQLSTGNTTMDFRSTAAGLQWTNGVTSIVRFNVTYFK